MIYIDLYTRYMCSSGKIYFWSSRIVFFVGACYNSTNACSNDFLVLLKFDLTCGNSSKIMGGSSIPSLELLKSFLFSYFLISIFKG